ncbi:MAG TPA: Hsp20/alpha crystallin family protein [Pontiella sp.]|nr:Hsp20/alpha crystallin family protein [Pontiella sp.]
MQGKLIPWKKRTELPQRGWRDDPFDLLHKEINELFDGYYRGFGNLGRPMPGSKAFELSETDTEIEVKVELPGINEKDIEVTLDEDIVTVRAERKEEREKRKRNYRFSEMSYGRFCRSIPLQAEVDRDKVKAVFKRGVLTLTFPKTGPDRIGRRHIPIHTG